jgi:hypothetical protein
MVFQAAGWLEEVGTSSAEISAHVSSPSIGRAVEIRLSLTVASLTGQAMS